MAASAGSSAVVQEEEGEKDGRGADPTGGTSSGVGNTASGGSGSTPWPPPPSQSTLQGVGRVVCKDAAAVARKRALLVEEGSEHLQVIADFDFTLTKFMVNGKRGCSCHGVIEECNLLSDEYHVNAAALKSHYYPLEVDMTLTHVQRVQFMVDWVDKAHELMIVHRLTKQDIVQAVRDANIDLRDGHGELFSLLEELQIPLLIFSAGIADVLEEVLAQHAKIPVPSTAHIISNRMNFKSSGHIESFRDPLFHVFNKHAATVQNEPYFQSDEVKRRGNVLLLGDSIGDLHMAEGLDVREVLTVGFLNDKVEERLDSFMSSYDVVIIGNASLDYPLELLRELKRA